MPLQSTEGCVRIQGKLDSALPELYASVIVFTIKARTYFEARGTCSIPHMLLNYAKPKSGGGKFAVALKSFDIEFRPFIEEINAKERAIQEYADAATMERIRSMILM